MPNSNKEKYRQLCEQKPIPLFMQAWWMDAVCCESKQWDVLLLEENNTITAALPFHLKTKFGFKLVLQPELTQYNGLWIDYPANCEKQQKYAFEKRVMSNIIEQLEKLKVDYFEQNFHYSITNWQPFFWKGYKQSTRYTLLIPDISNPESVLREFHQSKKRHIKKASESLKVDLSLQPKEFYKLYAQQLKSKGEKAHYSETLFESICAAAIDRKQGAILSLKDENKEIHASLFAVWDSQSAYNLVYYINPKFKSGGASSLVVFEMINYLSDKTKAFDFEGSMIETVAESYQMFGSEQKAYFTISKAKSKLLSLLIALYR